MSTVAVSNPLEELSLDQLRRRGSMKWRTHPADVLPLWVAEMDVPLAAPVADALQNAIRLGDTGYPAGDDYAHALAGFASQRWGWHDFPVGRARLVPDVMMGIVEVLRLITEPGDPVVVNAPVYAPFYAFVTHAGRTVVEAPLTARGRVDLGTLDAAFRHAGAVSRRVTYLLCNPHNPTGAVHTEAELRAIAALAGEHGVRVIADEIHGPLVLPGARFTPYLTVPGSSDAFAVTSATKAWNLAGLKAALAVAGEEAAPDLARMPEEVGHGPSHLGVIAHTAALRHGGDWLDALLGGLDRNRALLGRLLSEHLPEVGYVPSEGTYLAWLDCRHLGLDDSIGTPGIVSDVVGPARFFLERAGVAVSSGEVFGTGGGGHVRLNFATSQATLTEAVTRMGAAATRGATGPAGRGGDAGCAP